MQQILIFPDVNSINASTIFDVDSNKKTNSTNNEAGLDFFALLQNAQNANQSEAEATSNTDITAKLGLASSALSNSWDFTAQNHRTGTGIETKKLDSLQKVNTNSNKVMTNEGANKKLCKKPDEVASQSEARVQESKANEETSRAQATELKEGVTGLLDEGLADLELCSELVDSVFLEDFISQLSQEDLAYLMENEATFEERLMALMQEVEAPELKEQLLEVVKEASSAELFNLVQPLMVQEQEVVQKPTEALELDLELEQDLASMSKKSQTSLKGKEEAKSESGTENSEEAVEASTTNSENKKEEVQDGSKAEKSEVKRASVEESKSVESGESLRQEFARIHKMDDVETIEMPVNSAELGFEAGEFAINELFEGNLTPTTSNLSQIYNMVDKLIEKAFEQLESKASKPGFSGIEKGELEAGLVKGTMASGSGSGSSGSSMGNGGGFSFQSGLGQGMSGEVGKSGQGLGTNGTSFTQMLERAELVKTKDGMKVLNLEVDQGEMGKLEMELKSKDGVVTARLSAESVAVKAELEKLAPQILERLASQGINLESINVDVSSNNSQDKRSGEAEQVSSRSRLSFGAGASFDQLIEGSRIDVLNELRRAALNIQYIDEIV